MSPDTCIYYRAGSGACASPVKPNCPWWTPAHECRCAGKIGRQGVLSDQKPPVVAPEPAPTLMRWRA